MNREVSILITTVLVDRLSVSEGLVVVFSGAVSDVA